MKEVSRCTGHCCKDFWLPVSPMELQFDLKRLQRTGRSRWGEIEKVATMVIFLRRDAKGNHYTCKHHDPATGNCTNYENRPAMCRDFPYNMPKCPYKQCTRRCEPDQEATDDGAEPKQVPQSVGPYQAEAAGVQRPQQDGI